MTEEDITESLTDFELNEKQQKNGKEAKKVRKNYGNKYLLNRNTISVVDTLFKRLESIQKQRSFNTKGELIEYLIELDRIYNPKLETVFKCKKCGERVDVLKDMNLDRIMHRDLCKTSPCNGSITTKQHIALPGTIGTQAGTKEQPIQIQTKKVIMIKDGDIERPKDELDELVEDGVTDRETANRIRNDNAEAIAETKQL